MGGEQPLAFLIGRKADRVFVSDLTGFDTRFEGFSPGKVMWNKVIQDLHEHGGFRWIDFGTGDIGYKQFWGHEFYRESSVYLIKLGLRTAAAFWPIMAVMWPVNVGRSLCEALSLGSAFDRTLHRLTKALKRRTRNW